MLIWLRTGDGRLPMPVPHLGTLYLTVSRTLILLCKYSNVTLRLSFFLHTSTFSAFEVSYKNALYKSTVIVIIFKLRSRGYFCHRGRMYNLNLIWFDLIWYFVFNTVIFCCTDVKIHLWLWQCFYTLYAELLTIGLLYGHRALLRYNHFVDHFSHRVT